MPQRQEQPPPSMIEDTKRAIGFGILLVGSLAVAHRLFFYWRWGKRAVGVDAFLGVGIVYPLFVQFVFPPTTVAEAQVFLWMWVALIALCVLHRFGYDKHAHS